MCRFAGEVTKQNYDDDDIVVVCDVSACVGLLDRE